MSVALFLLLCPHLSTLHPYANYHTDPSRVQNSKEPNADPISMLLANLSKSSSIIRLVSLTRTVVPALSPSKLAITQLLELFNKGADGGYNTEARFDYLAWFFGDLAKVRSSSFYHTRLCV